MNLYSEKHQVLHFCNYPFGDIGGIIIRILYSGDIRDG